MIRIIRAGALSLFFVSSFGFANEIPAALQSVAYIHHPTQQHFTGGQPTQAQYAAFAEEGVRHVIDFRPPQESVDINGAARASEQGMAYYNIPIASGEDLTKEHVAVLDTILTRIGDEKALLHCASSNRVGAMMALYGIWYQGMDEEEAVNLGKDYGMTSLEPYVREAAR